MRVVPGVDSLLGEGGALSAVLEGYEVRPEQLAMARAVERAFERREYLLAEAGTGTGKTIAYLLPAALSGRRVVVSTATKTLQEQVFFKDVPLLRDRLGVSFGAAYLKGRSNYLCLQRFEAFRANPLLGTPDEADLWPSFVEWAERTETGDRGELDLPESFSAWSKLSTTAETCLGTRCPLYESCFVTRMRRRAEEADVVVVNHHLFFADLQLRSTGRGDGILPRYDAVVFDEAHALEDAAIEHFGHRVSSHRVEDLAADCLRLLDGRDERKGMLDALALKLRGDADRYFHGVARTLGLHREGTVPLSGGELAPVSADAVRLVDALKSLESFTAAHDDPDLVAITRRSGEIAAAIELLQDGRSDEHVHWAEKRDRGVFLRASPVELGGELRQRLYGAVDTVVFTSATLTAQGRFDFFARRMGLDVAEAEGTIGEVQQVAVSSPFDYRRQAALYLPTGLPEPNQPGFVEAVSEEVVRLCELSGGRAFVLFTSLRNMDAAHALCRDRLPFQVLLQGERPKAALLEAFREEPSVLFASHSFWEGVDVAGDALSLVIIDKLPFASPQDPLVAARIRRLEERGEDPFNGYQLPQAAISLRQGFGRLIRTRADRGIVAILDRRITQRAYGRAFLKSLPPATRVTDLDALEAWWHRGR